MTRRGWRTVFDRHLVDGLTVDERIARLEGTTDAAAERVEDLEWNVEHLLAAERRRRRPFYRRWLDWLP